MHRFALLTSFATLFLIFAGGLVTTTGSGLAVPDWPLSYGSLFPPMVGGVFYEHGHRMVAAAVGLLMVALAVWIFLREPRRWVGRLAAAALAAVVVQGALGGLTVLLLLPPAVSITHACLAQTFFCLTVALAVVTGPSWRKARSRPPAGAALAPAAIVLAAAVYLQLVVGAVMRHMGAGLAIPDFPLSFGTILPPLDSAPVAVAFAHRFWGLVVALLALRMTARVIVVHRNDRALLVPAALLGALAVAQVSLGALAVWTSRAMVPTTLHVACGAAILGLSVVLALQTARLARLGAGGAGGVRAVRAGALPRQG
ncbi:MAG TPA: COX15/CtaA family protein, partial [Candidatus Polarisedimenticolia bacterium]|nr:COX15/CtaA family protein [Candidatus Polarisedimenticolia bacterium]